MGILGTTLTGSSTQFDDVKQEVLAAIGTAMQGPPGERGERGLTGSSGLNGRDGYDGAPGTPGAKGDKGDPGTPGTIFSTGDYAITAHTHNVATNTTIGFLPVLSGASSQFLTSTGGWNTLEKEMYRAYTTGNGSTLFAALSTYVSTLATTSKAQPLYSICVPPYVGPSRIDISLSVAACSSNTANSYCVIVSDCKSRTDLGTHDFVTTATLSTSKAGVIFGYFPTTSNWATFTTQMRIVGGQWITIYALSTTAPLLKVKDIKIMGTISTAVYPGDTWDSLCGSTQG
jgi:hypothetical protein